MIKSECGKAAMNSAAPYSHQSKKLFPLPFAINAGIRPISAAAIKSAVNLSLSSFAKRDEHPLKNAIFHDAESAKLFQF